MPADAVCVALTSFAHAMLGLVAPVIVSIYAWRLADRAPGPSDTAHAAGGASTWQRLRRASRRAAGAADRQIHRLIGAHKRPLIRALVVWYICANAWAWCKISAGLL